MSEDISNRDHSGGDAPIGEEQTEDMVQVCDAVLLDMAPAAALLVDAFGRIMRANKRACELLTLPEQSVLGTRIHHYLFANSAQAFALFFAQAAESGELKTGEMLFKSASNEAIEMLIQARPVHLQDGRFLVISLSDISQWRSVSPELILVDERLHHSQKMEALGRLSAGVVHDFNNILTIIAGYSNILLEDLEVSLLRQHVQKIAHASERASGLVSNILLYGRHEDASAERVLNLNDRVIAFEDLFVGIVSDQVELEACLEPNLPGIRIDASQVDQILMNLAINARDAMEKGGVLSFETSSRFLGADRPAHLGHLSPGPYVELTVRDTGCGMEPEVAERAFYPFFSTKGVTQGTGLGLATVRSIMHECGGEVELTTSPQNGSCFRLLFPCADSSVEPLSDSVHEVLRAESDGAHLLVVDTNPDVRALIAYVMEKKGYIVAQSNLADANETFRSASPPFTLVLVDKNLPKTQLKELMSGLRAHQPTIKFLFLSSYGSNQAVEAGSAELQKPFTSHQLYQAVHALLHS